MHSATGSEYRIFISCPRSPPPPTGFPVIYLLDANAMFGTVVEAIRLRSSRPDVTGVVPAVVVGIGYPTDAPYDRARRRFDYTPLALPGQAPESDSEVGGAEMFQRFLYEKLRPEIERDFPIDPARQTIFGHSLAGFFVLNLLRSDPQSFRSYVVASPSIWWGREVVFDAVGSLTHWLSNGSGQVRLMIGVGEYEQKLAPWENASADANRTAERRRSRAMVDNAREFAMRLQALGNTRLNVHFEEFEGEDHASAVLRTVSRCLRFVLAP